MFVGLFLASCSTGRYVPNSFNQNLNQTQVVLSEANFRVVKHVSTSVVFRQSLRFDADQLSQSAYAALVRKANLTGSQVLINITMEQVKRESGFWTIKEDNALLVSGTVIEFINPNASQEEDILSNAVIGGGSLTSGGAIQRPTSAIPTQLTKQEELQKEYLALQDAKYQSSGDKSLLGKYKRANLVIINASTAGEKECEKYRKNFMSRFNELMAQQLYKDFTLKSNAQELIAELIIIDYNNDIASGFIRFKDASGSILYSRCLMATSARINAAGFANLLQNEF